MTSLLTFVSISWPTIISDSFKSFPLIKLLFFATSVSAKRLWCFARNLSTTIFLWLLIARFGSLLVNLNFGAFKAIDLDLEFVASSIVLKAIDLDLEFLGSSIVLKERLSGFRAFFGVLSSVWYLCDSCLELISLIWYDAVLQVIYSN